MKRNGGYSHYSGMPSAGGLASESSMGGSSDEESFDGRVPRAPAASPSVGPVRGEVFMGSE